MEYTTGTKIDCYYHNRRVSGVILEDASKYIVVQLTIQYQGKNELWDVGERKVLYKSLLTL